MAGSLDKISSLKANKELIKYKAFYALEFDGRDHSVQVTI